MRRYWNALTDCRSLLYERYHRLASRPSPPADPTWPPPAGGYPVEIVWPVHYAWVEAGKWVEPIVSEMAKLVPVTRDAIPQSNPRAVGFHIRHGGRELPAVLDYGDYKDEIDEAALARAIVYFKMQYRTDGYGNPRVTPGGYVTVSERSYHYLASLRKEKDGRSELYDVYGRFGMRFAGDIRRRVVGALTEQNRFRYEGGLTKVRYSRFLREVARAKICIDLPGNGDFCYRLVDYFSIGSCVLAARHGTQFPAPLVDREHLVYFADDGSDLLELCDYYLRRPDERLKLVDNSRTYFDQHLHRTQLAGYYLHEIWKRLPHDQSQ